MIFLLSFGLDFILRVDLAKHNPEAYAVCLELLKNPVIKQKKLFLYIARNPITLLALRKNVAWVMPLTGTIYLEPNFNFTNRRYLIATVAHELGHRELKHYTRWPDSYKNDQFEADFFALKLLGYDQMGYFISWTSNIPESEKELLVATYKQYLRTERPPFEYASKSHYQICRRLANHRSFTAGEVIFKLGSDEDRGNSPVIGSFVKSDEEKNVQKIVYIDLETLDNPYFESSVAHELGHIQFNTPNHIVADKFACVLTSKEKVLAWLQSYQADARVDQKNIRQRIEALIRN